MATHDYVIANGSGAAVRSDLNNALAAIVSNNSSSTEPATTYAYQWWADTNTSLLKLRNSANSAWITIRALDGALTVADGSAASPALAFTDDTNTGLFSGANDTVGLSTAGVERFNVTTTEVVVNDPSNDVNFRVESNNAANMLFVDGGNDRVGINEGTPDAHLHVNSGSTDVVAKFESTDAGASIDLVDSDATSKINQVGSALEINSDSGNADADSTLKFLVDNTTRATIDSSGRLLIGHATGSGNNLLHISKSVNSGDVGLIVQNSGTSSNTASLYLNKGSGAEPDFRIQNDTGGNLTFARGTNESTYTQHLKITANGALKATTNSFYSTNDAHEFRNGTSNTPILFIQNTNGSYADHLFRMVADRGASQSYDFGRWESGGVGGDNEYRFRGDGSAFADGDWNAGGADYAEFFEWSDGNASDEDRRGISVVLVNDKIREAVAGEDPIGVISGNPSVVGDAAWNKWSGKHLRDDYGSYVLDANGDRQLNPDYDPDLTYVPREERPEWGCVGLMGKLRIRTGQVTGSRWIKMRDVSATVEEWLVR